MMSRTELRRKRMKSMYKHTMIGRLISFLGFVIFLLLGIYCFFTYHDFLAFLCVLPTMVFGASAFGIIE